MNYFNDSILIPIKCERKQIAGVDCVVYEEAKLSIWNDALWNVTHRKTGMRIALCETRKQAIDLAKKRIVSEMWDDAINKGIAELKENGFNYPLNK